MSEPKVASKEPFEVELEEGKTYYWCKCGLSNNQPFCDGSHKTTDFEPLKYTASMTRKKRFCGCKHTKMPPFCDGSHLDL